MNAEAPAKGRSAATAWLRALELTAPIARNPERLLATVLAEQVERRGDAPALLSDRETMTYRELVARANQYARWALEQRLAKGEVVCLLMTNRPEYLAVWLGITSVGGVVALLNTNLVGASLAHCIDVVSPKHLIVSAEFADALEGARAEMRSAPVVWGHGVEGAELRGIEAALERQAVGALSAAERRATRVEDLALFIYTSGTTGMPKAARVSHARILQWSHWFAGMMEARPEDRMYNCLPMYHSVGGVLAPGAALAGGGSVVLRERFSASQFWKEIVRWECTTFQYIGELCRYLLHAAPAPEETEHRIRIACGNGLSAEVWEEFQSRFGIPQILEFYAATEGGVSLFNVQGKRGAIGHIPAYLAHRFAPALVRFDVAEEKAVRDERGFCIRCGANEVGEALGKVVDDPANLGGRFEGYSNAEADEKKILRDVFEAGDAWVRTGDLMRKDEKGYFYFVDRIGDTFRWKGENVATSEVAEAMGAFRGVRHANVYGVTVAGAEGRAGMAALVLEGELDWAGLRRHLAARLPPYARPLFLRVQSEVEVTGTFKYAKTELVRQGFDPAATGDALYFDDAESEAFVPLDGALFERIQRGEIRL